MDGLSTLLIAGLKEEFISALNYTISIDFTAADGLVNPFETIIRLDVLLLCIKNSGNNR